MSESSSKEQPTSISRREFLKKTAAVIAGGAIAATGLYDHQSGSLGLIDKLTGPFPRISLLPELDGINDPLDRPIYFGVAANDNKWIPTEKGFETVERIGKPNAIRHFYQDWSGKPEASNFQQQAMENMRMAGSIPLVTWMPQEAGRDPFSQPDFSLATITQGRHDEYIRRWAEQAKAWNHPFFLRFGHEMNLGGFPWGVGKHWRSGSVPNNNSPTDFVNAWRHCHDIFKAVGASPTWVWCPDTSGDISIVDDLYPGDEYVDWTGMDGYNWGTTSGGHQTKFRDIFSPLYNKLLNIAPNKAIMLAEFGVSKRASGRAEWLKDALNNEIPYSFRQIQAAVYFDRDRTQEEGVNWLIEGDREMEQAFSNIVRSPFYKGNEFSNLPLTAIPIARTLNKAK